MSGEVSRRTVVVGGAAVLAGALAAPSAGTLAPHASIALHGETVARGDGARHLVEVGGAVEVVPRSRVLIGRADTDTLLADEGAWLADPPSWVGAVDRRWHGLLRDARLDLHVLTAGLPVGVAGWSRNWRYAWPRDGAHVVAALLALGKPREAVHQLLFFQDVLEPGAWFHARYHLDRRPVRDGRGRQLDGTGWLLWACGRLAEQDAKGAEALTDLVRHCTEVLCGQVRDGLPAVSPDYWEVPERRLTLGTAAPVLAGLRAATSPALQGVLDAGAREHAGVVHARTHDRVLDAFSVDGFPRHLGRRLPDAAIAFLAPPYLPEARADVRDALPRIGERLRRPAGGLAPGVGWRRDGISWTPQTALFASAHAHLGDHDRAAELLDWLAEHRTAAGSLPEKVLADGSPAAVAPLAWTAALVVLALRAQAGHG